MAKAMYSGNWIASGIHVLSRSKSNVSLFPALLYDADRSGTEDKRARFVTCRKDINLQN